MKPTSRTRTEKAVKSSERSNHHPSTVGDERSRWILTAVVVAAATFIAFLPVLQNEFVDWDDYETLLVNPYYRGLDWSRLRWMFTTFHMGHYQPLSWVSLGLDYLVWGINPLGYHLTNLILHACNALLFFFVVRLLFEQAFDQAGHESECACVISAGFSALLFSIHPLRVESVAWATERRDVLSGLFYLCTIYAYLRAQREFKADGRSRNWLVSALALYILSLLSKATAITLPAVLLLLDIYPLRRLPWDLRQWLASETRAVWREKIPFVAVAVVFAAIAILSQQRAGALKSFESYAIGPRIAQVFFGVGFYLWKTLVPFGLSPLYEIPPNYNLWNSASLISGAAILLISIGAFLVRHRWPAGLTSWLYYLTVLAPVLGLTQTGPQLVADRYSYLSCLGWAILSGGVLLIFLRRDEQQQRGFAVSATLTATALTLLVGLACLTWQQTTVWRNPETLWARALEIDPTSSYAHYNLARYLASKGMYQKAMHHYGEALRIRPDDADTHNNLGLLLAANGQVEASLVQFHQAVEIDPRYGKSYFNLGRVHAQQGDLEKAVTYLRKALELDPNEAEIHLTLGTVLARQGQSAEPRIRFEEAIRLNPDFADAHVAFARLLASQGKIEEAEKQYQKALRLMKSQMQKLPPSPADAAANEIPGAGDALQAPAR
jgi:Tfp pilus assembly protein PilF